MKLRTTDRLLVSLLGEPCGLRVRFLHINLRGLWKRLATGGKLAFRKYEVAPRLGTQAVRRRLLRRLREACAPLDIQPLMDPDARG